MFSSSLDFVFFYNLKSTVWCVLKSQQSTIYLVGSSIHSHMHIFRPLVFVYVCLQDQASALHKIANMIATGFDENDWDASVTLIHGKKLVCLSQTEVDMP